MMHRLMAAMRTQAAMAQNGQAAQRTGIVSSYDPNTFAVKVLLQPENVESNWLPLLSPWVGNGWGMFAPPSLGDMVDVGFADNDPDAGYAALRYFNDTARPLPVVSGEFWLVHQTGGFLKLTNDGKVLINGQAEVDVTAPTLNITISGNANLTVGGNINSSAAQWNHTGPVHFSDNVQVDKTLTATTDVVGGGISLLHHTHGGVQGGGANTQPPNP